MIFYILSVIFLIIIIKYLCSKRKEAASGLIEDLDYKHHLCKIYVLYMIYIGIFFVSFSLNNEKDRDEYYPDLIYLILVFFLDLTYFVNRVLMKETLKIFCKKTYKEKYESIKTMKLFGDIDKHEENDDDDEEIAKKQRTESF